MILTAQVLIYPAASSSSSVVGFPIAPFCNGVQYPQETFTPTAAYDDGDPFILMKFPPLFPAQFVLTLARAGLSTAKTANVTVAVPGTDGMTYVYYNGQAVNLRREQRLQLQFTGVEILVRTLVAI